MVTVDVGLVYPSTLRTIFPLVNMVFVIGILIDNTEEALVNVKNVDGVAVPITVPDGLLNVNLE